MAAISISVVKRAKNVLFFIDWILFERSKVVKIRIFVSESIYFRKFAAELRSPDCGWLTIAVDRHCGLDPQSPKRRSVISTNGRWDISQLLTLSELKAFFSAVDISKLGSYDKKTEIFKKR